MDVSIIVPVYRGNKFIPVLLEQFKQNYLYAKGRGFSNLTVELIFVNDSPEDELLTFDDVAYKFASVINNKHNYGIQKSRIEGLHKSKGDYVVFFDQDDLVKEDWLYNLYAFAKRNNAELVVCNGWKSRFSLIRPLGFLKENVNNMDYYLDVDNPIVSPGQVLIKKSAIPRSWMNNTLMNNGADDYLLWMLLLLSGKHFNVVDIPLYFHVPERRAESVSAARINSSLEEAINLIIGLELVSEEDSLRLKVMLDKRKSRTLNVFRDMFFYMETWKQAEISGFSLTDFFAKWESKIVAIYGLGRVGILFYEELTRSGIQVDFAIDRLASDYNDTIDIYHPDHTLPAADLIVITAADSNEQIKNDLRAKFSKKTEILYLNELFWQ